MRVVSLLGCGPEGGELHRLVALDRRRVGDAPVDVLRRTGEDRAGFPGVVADRDDVVELLTE